SDRDWSSDVCSSDLSAIDVGAADIPSRALLRLLRLSPSRFHAWRRRRIACALDDQSSCPRTSPHRLTPSEVRGIEDMVTSPEYRHVPTGTLAVLAQRPGGRSEEHTSELQSRSDLVCRLLLEKKNT